MRYRKLDANGDYTFGHGSTDFYVDSPQAVAQAIKTRLLLFEGEWFLDLTEGTPYFQQVIGFGTDATRDQALRERILGTQGVVKLTSYSSDLTSRNFSVAGTVETQYGTASVVV